MWEAIFFVVGIVAGVFGSLIYGLIAAEMELEKQIMTEAPRQPVDVKPATKRVRKPKAAKPVEGVGAVDQQTFRSGATQWTQE